MFEYLVNEFNSKLSLIKSQSKMESKLKNPTLNQSKIIGV